METTCAYSREQAIENGILIRFEDFIRREQRELTHQQRVKFSRSIGRLKRESRTPRFHLGELGITTSAAEKVGALQALALLVRHQSGDWGDVCVFGRQQNANALRQGLRLLSVYDTSDSNGEELRVSVITESNREATTILIPEDYEETEKPKMKKVLVYSPEGQPIEFIIDRDREMVLDAESHRFVADLVQTQVSLIRNKAGVVVGVEVIHLCESPEGEEFCIDASFDY